jgi:hypothetical protein
MLATEDRVTRHQLVQLLGFTGLAWLLFSAAIVAGVGLDEWPQARPVCMLALPALVVAFVLVGRSLVESRQEETD